MFWVKRTQSDQAVHDTSNEDVHVARAGSRQLANSVCSRATLLSLACVKSELVRAAMIVKLAASA